MYYKVFERFSRGAAPFHNRMIRSNYALPERTMGEILDLCFDTLCKDGPLLYCDDMVEEGFFFKKEVIEVPRDRPLALIKKRGGQWGGFFNGGLDFYVRASMEPPRYVAPGEKRGGEFELYCADENLMGLFTAIIEKYEGFFIVDSPKKRLEEILF